MPLLSLQATTATRSHGSSRIALGIAALGLLSACGIGREPQRLSNPHQQPIATEITRSETLDGFFLVNCRPDPRGNPTPGNYFSASGPDFQDALRQGMDDASRDPEATPEPDPLELRQVALGYVCHTLSQGKPVSGFTPITIIGS